MSVIKNLYSIETGNFKLDGGAMFGVVPKVIWEKTNPADDLNMIDMAARSLLIETTNKLILIDAGLGDKQNEKFFSHYYKWGGDSIENSIKKGIDSIGLGNLLIFSDNNIFKVKQFLDNRNINVRLRN